MKTVGKIATDWLKRADVQQLFDVLEQDGDEARIVGGAVRNALLRSDVPSDLDFATTKEPSAVVEALETAGLKAVPTGIDHGTVTAVIDGHAYEITTLRKDIETDGRHAVVAFGTDFAEDAKRRDFTINAIYVDRKGQLYDPGNGLDDVENRTVRFIGDAAKRIEEDYLRILRFFRFFAWYGQFRPDGEGLKACSLLKSGVTQLSAERIWQEMRKLFAAPDPSRALLWMRQVGVLTLVLPESEKWGIDAIPALLDAEQQHGLPIDPLIRLMAIIPPRQEAVNDIAKRWKLSNADRDRLRAWAMLPAQLPTDDKSMQALAYRHSKRAALDALVVQAAMRKSEELAKLHRVLGQWDVPIMPIKGADLIKQGFEKGPELGAKLKSLEEAWIDSDFTLDRAALLELI